MGETLLPFDGTIRASEGTQYEASACGDAMPDGRWEGWIEFVPVAGGPPIRSPRETVQPNRADLAYWATGLTRVYLEGALVRALERPAGTAPGRPLRAALPRPSFFDGPAPPSRPAIEALPASILDPFAACEKGEDFLRHRLSALAAWRLVNIAVDYRLTGAAPEDLSRLAPAVLIDIIVDAVRERTAVRPARRR